jgi:protein-S-isoprenylcysteine O-methyltransferase Ste14
MSFVPAFEIGLWNAWIFMLLDLLTLPFFLHIGKNRGMSGPDVIKMSKTVKFIASSSKLILIPASIYSIFLPLKLGTIWFYVGLPITLFGLVLGIIVLMNWAATPSGETITRGLYRYSRHPMYISYFVFFLGLSIITASWVFFLFLVIFIVGCVIFIDLEEALTLEEYGDSYLNYMKKTPRWLIGIPKHQSPLWFSDKCISCGDCSDICNFKALRIVDKKPVINRDICKACMQCVSVCKFDALVKPEKSFY